MKGVAIQMVEVAPSDVTEVLEHLHGKLNSHFRRLHEQREQLEPASPVFALEHDLGFADLSYFSRFVRRMTGSTPTALRRRIA